MILAPLPPGRPALKFRAWDPKTRTWISPRKVQDAIIPVTRTSIGFQLKTRFDLSQFTGIIDHDEVDIYEGDIMAGYMATGNGRTARKRFQRFLVEWNNWSHGWYLNSAVKGDWRFFPSFRECVVVGNKWENPEWIEE